VFDVIVPKGRVYVGTRDPWTELDLGIAGRRIVVVGSLNAAKRGTGEVLENTGGDR
jgi:N-acyl-D-aspartate/D-glutamate deacylase